MTRAEAAAGAEERIRETTSQLFPEAELEFQSDENAPCGGWGDDRAFAVEVTYWIRGVPEGQNVDRMYATKDWWLERGYRLNRETHDGTGRFTGVSVYDPDEFYLRIARNSQDDLWITGASPCIPRERE